jgi:hypothetical protein
MRTGFSQPINRGANYRQSRWLAVDVENRRIIAALTQRIPELEAPREQLPSQEPPESPQTPRIKPERAEPAEPVDPYRAEPERVQPEREEPDRVEPRPDQEEPQEGAERVPWWRRVFGG